LIKKANPDFKSGEACGRGVLTEKGGKSRLHGSCKVIVQNSQRSGLASCPIGVRDRRGVAGRKGVSMTVAANE